MSPADTDTEIGEQMLEPARRKLPMKLACVCIGSALLVVGYVASGAAKKSSIATVDPVGFVSKFEEPDFPPQVKEKFIEDCTFAFQQGNKQITTWPKHRINEDALPKVCEKYWAGYLKGWMPWKGNANMYPPAQQIGRFGDFCYHRDDHTKDYWTPLYGCFLFPDVEGKNGNACIVDCGKFLDFVAEADGIEAQKLEAPKGEKSKCKQTGEVVKVKNGYCSSDRIPLGPDKKHGKGNPSLEACGHEALNNMDCAADGYFDAVKVNGKYQCKCPRGTCVQSKNKQSPGWKIYQMIPDTDGHTCE